MNAGDVRAAVERYYAAVNTRSIDALAAMFAPDAVMRDPVGMPAAADDASRRQRYDGIALAFETFTISAGRIIAVAGEAAAQWSATGRARNGRDVSFDGLSTFTFDADGRISQMSAYWDVGAIMSAMAG